MCGIGLEADVGLDHVGPNGVPNRRYLRSEQVLGSIHTSGRFMASKGNHNWSGKSGVEYVYRIFKMPPRLKAMPGNYIFAKRTTIGGWIAVYIGETNDLREHFRDHPAQFCIRGHKATHIHAHLSDEDAPDRRTEAEDLIAIWQPPCNDY